MGRSDFKLIRSARPETETDLSSPCFRAIYRLGSGWGFLEENSDFFREDDRWYYVRGDSSTCVAGPGLGFV